MLAVEIGVDSRGREYDDMMNRSRHGVAHHSGLVVHLDVIGLRECIVLFILGKVLVAFDILDPFQFVDVFDFFRDLSDDVGVWLGPES